MLETRWQGTFALLAAICAPTIVSPSVAQTTEPGSTPNPSSDSLQEILVTAERRSTKLQETPLAVTAVSGDTMESRNIRTLQDLSFSVPTLEMGVTLGLAHPAIRGVGASDIIFGSDPRIAFYLDDVYVARPEAQLGVLFDVNQVEVLNGPQGTLYGRNATGGALLVSSRKPSETPTGYINLTTGNYGEIQSDGALSGALAPTLSARIAFQTLDHDGYGKNVLTGSGIDNARQRSIRLSFLWKPTGDFNFLVQSDYHREHDRDYAMHYGGFGSLTNPPVLPAGLLLGGFVLPIGSRDVASVNDPINDREIWGVNATATWNLGDLTLKSITGYRHMNLTLGAQVDPSSLSLAPLYSLQTARQVSQELQAVGEFGRNSWIAGVSYFDEHLAGQVPVGFNLRLFGGPNLLVQGVNSAGDETTESVATFARYSYKFTDQLTATLGGRFTHEKKTIFNEFAFDLTTPFSLDNPIANVPPFPYHDEKSYAAFTPSGTLDYKFTPDIFGYVTVTQGFKSGGFNIGVDQPAFKPEKIWDYEAGLKSTFLNQRLQVNIAAFHYNYSNLQVSIVEGTQILIQNAAKATIDGGEFQVTALPTGHLQLDLSLAALHSQYKSYITTDPTAPQLGAQDLAGNQLTQAPKLKVNAGAQYTWNIPSGKISLRGEYSWTDDIFFTPFDTHNSWSPRHSKSNAFLSYDELHWSATAFVRNLANKTIIADAYNATGLVGFPVNASLEPPRTFGLTVGYKF
jgi:iron complex outermembrane recepter protein